MKLIPVLVCVALLIAAARAQTLGHRWSVFSTNAGPTAGLQDFAAGYDQINNQIIVFGGGAGNDQTHLYNMSTNTWTEVTTSSQKPPPRFSMVYGMDQTAGRNRFLISTGEGPGRVFYNDVWAFDLTTNQWSEVTTSGVPPEIRYGASGGTFFADSQYLYVTHGFKKTVRFCDTFALRLSDSTWIDMTPKGGLPHARCLHSGALTSNSQMFMFGGCGSGGYGPCPARSTWVLNNNFGGTPSQAAGDWDRLSSCPRPAMRSTMSLGPGQANGTTVSQLVMFGGVSKPFPNKAAGNLGVLNTASGEWTLMIPAGASVPSTQQGMALLYINSRNNQLTDTDYVLLLGDAGGIWRLDADSSVTPDTLACPWLFNLRLFHGVMMFLSWGVLLPLGITIARFGKKWKSVSFGCIKIEGAVWFKIHRPMQAFGLILALGGFIAAFFMVGTGKMSAPIHPQVGIVVMVLGILQPVNAFFRPHPEPRTTYRKVWEYLHKYSGRVAVVLGMIQPFQGLQFILAPTALTVLYGLYFALFWLFYIIMTVKGEPAGSPVAFVANKYLGCCFKRVQVEELKSNIELKTS